MGDLGSQDARVVAAEEGSGVGVQGVAEVGLVVGSGQDAGGITLLDVALLAGLLDLGGAAGDVAGGDTAGLELVSAVSQAGALDIAEEAAALGDLLSEVMAGVGNGAGEEGKAGRDGRETHCGSCWSSVLVAKSWGKNVFIRLLVGMNKRIVGSESER